jgi:hypothetical protein
MPVDLIIAKRHPRSIKLKNLRQDLFLSMEVLKLLSTYVTFSARPEYDGKTFVQKFKFFDSETLELEFENTEEFRKYAIWKKD